MRTCELHCLLTPCGRLQVILMAGLQGVGKTTACGKLALYLQKQGKKVPIPSFGVSCSSSCDKPRSRAYSPTLPKLQMWL